MYLILFYIKKVLVCASFPLCHYYSTYNLFMLQEVFNLSDSPFLHMHNSEGGLHFVFCGPSTEIHVLAHSIVDIRISGLNCCVHKAFLCSFCMLYDVWPFQWTAWQKKIVCEGPLYSFLCRERCFR